MSNEISTYYPETTSKLSCLPYIFGISHHADFLVVQISTCHFLLLKLFKKNYILKQEDNYNNVENQYEIKTWKNSENPHKPIKGWTENGKGSMFFIACNLFGELAWDLQDVSSRVCRRQLATCLLKLVGSWLLAFSSLGWTIWIKQHSEQVDI